MITVHLMAAMKWKKEELTQTHLQKEWGTRCIMDVQTTQNGTGEEFIAHILLGEMNWYVETEVV